MKKTSEAQLRHLEQRHQHLDSELHSLTDRPHLTPREYEQARHLKKLKLVAKDGIVALRQALATSA